MLLEIALFVLTVTAVSMFFQDKFGIPTPITLILLVIACKFYGYSPLLLSDYQFDQLVMFLLPILITVDTLMLKLSEIKKHAFSLFYLAVIMVISSVLMAMLLNRYILPIYSLSYPAVAVLFCMIMATDPVSVSSVFGKFKLPHNLKILAEGESLFNDASALIVFSIALAFLGHSHNGNVIDSIPVYSISVVLGALIIGLFTGLIGLFMIRLMTNPIAETCMILAISFVSYATAEHFHFSGILAIIVSILFANSIITKRIDDSDKALISETPLKVGFTKKLLFNFENIVTEKSNYNVILGNIQYSAVFAASILFITMAELMDIHILVKYWKEIFSVFIGTTLIRMVMLGILSLISKRTDKVHSIPYHWWLVLSGAGVKGAFSLLMLHMIPRSFEYKELFDAIVIGNVLLSTFIYPAFLVLIIRAYKSIFQKEYEDEHQAK